MNNQTSISFPVHVNSLDAYYNQVLPTLPKRRRLVYSIIHQLGQATLKDIADYLSSPLHTFSGRITELKKMGLIKEVGRKKIGESSFSIYEINASV